MRVDSRGDQCTRNDQGRPADALPAVNGDILS